MRRIALDCETTGLSPKSGDRIVEIGCVEINDFSIGSTYHSLINPQCEVSAEVVKIHGITNEMLKDQPIFRDIWKELLEFIQGSQLIIHNAPFDISFLDAEVRKIGIPSALRASNCTVFDTLPFARALHPKSKNTLNALSKRYSIDWGSRKSHRALADAEVLAKLYLAMIR